MKLLALHSAKGGVGKTSAAVNLAFLAASEALHTLLVDLDPQASASYIYRMEAPDGFGGKRLLKGKGLEEGVRASDYEKLDLLPASLSFRKLDAMLSEKGGAKAKKTFASALKPFEKSYDLLVLDCPPGMSPLAESVYAVCDLALCPLIPTPLSTGSLAKLIEFLEGRDADSGKLKFFLSMTQLKKKVQAEAFEHLKRSAGKSLLKSQIPFASEVERMAALREPLCAAKGGGKAATAFRELWDEVRAELTL